MIRPRATPCTVAPLWGVPPGRWAPGAVAAVTGRAALPDRPGVHRVVGALEFVVAQQHVVQGRVAVQAAGAFGVPDRLGLPDGAVAAGAAAFVDDAEQSVAVV